MSKQIVEMLLPRLARNLYRELKRFRSGQLDEAQFTRSFEQLLQQQHDWLTQRGVPEVRAALAIHGAVLILSTPGLRAEATENGVPLEMVEYRAIREAASDVARNYRISEGRATQAIGDIVARYGQ